MEQEAIVTNIQKFSVHDGPGIRSIVFFKGCPLKCQWCANPENIKPKPQLMIHDVKCIHCGLCIDRCPNQAITVKDGALDLIEERCTDCGECTKICPSQARVFKGKTMTVEEIRREIDKDIPFYETSGGGVTFSGGEPLLYTDVIREISEAYHEMKLNTAVETCGCVPWANFEKVRSCIDLFLFDLKFVNCEKHQRYCGGGNELILSNLRKLCSTNRVTVRMPIIPGINDTEEDLDAAIAFLKELDHVEEIHCLPYHNMGLSKYEALRMAYQLNDVELPSDEYMARIKEKFELNDLKIIIGG